MNPRYRSLPAVFFCTILLLSAAAATPVAARGATISDVSPGDTIFVYETGLNLTALRNAPDVPVTALRLYTDNNPAKGVANEISVEDDTNFELRKVDVEDDAGTYYAYSPGIDAGNWIMIRYPEVEIDAVLAAPNHSDRISGISIPIGTPIAIKLSSRVGQNYRAGDTTAAVEIVIITPGGAELTSFQGVDYSNIPLRGSEIYTDDPGMPGALVLDNLEQGTYKVQARWTSPQGFADYADDSNIITFSVGEKIAVNTTPTTATTTAPTTLPTTVITTTATMTVPTPSPSLTTAATTTPMPVTTMTQASGTIIPALGAAALLLFALRRR
ncbi:DUF3821 domain-containing protein [uncultured Methanofollis sp.]|uniref:DUF3821 domain-containing protein n=1 Tax=uncultured Methanofollis sp. TaxID=262500 RepID=UPI002623F1F7|nr:DUF3821 domain-containing protein [uncultured Methanofollis sp.]